VKTYPARHAISTATLVAAVALSSLADAALAGQSRTSAAARAARERNTELYHRQMKLNRLGEDARKASKSEREPQLALKQIKEDFESLQSVNNDMMRDSAGDQALDFKLISESAGEINKRAKRLRANLAMPAAVKKDQDKKDQKKPEAIEGEQMKATLIKLDSFIMSFVTNPLFQNPKVLDAQLSSRAGNDLDNIIELSHSISKSAEKLRKNP
jgi:hypothetical protein